MAKSKIDKLKTAGADMDKFFSGASEKAPEPVKKATRGRAKAQPEKAQEGPERAQEGAEKVQKKVFSFRAEVEAVDSWRVWADAKGMKVDELGEKALTEYIQRHKLTEDQEKIYELKMAQKKS